MKLFKVLLLTISICIISSAHVRDYAYPVTADVEDICGRNYFSAVHNALQNAKKSIFVVMYFINLDPNKNNEVKTLVDDLVEAHKQRVKVNVILDRNIQFRKQRQANRKFHVEEKNKKAFEYLKEAGIEVYYDTNVTYTHLKAIIIDKQKIIVGSNNWSESSLKRNNEAGVLINSTKIAKSFLNYFNTIGIDYEESKKDVLPYLQLPKSTLTGSLSRFITTNNKGCWNLYLWLVRKYEPGQTIDFDYSLAEADLEYGGDLNRYRARMNENLKKLDEEYGLLKAKFAYGKNAEITMKLFSTAEKQYFEIPETFWKYGWDERLPLSAQFCLFINLLKSGPNQKIWFDSKKRLSKEFNVSHTIITNGMLALKKWNLIDIERGSIEKGFANRPANRYRVKNIYSLDDFEKELKKLKDKYGANTVKQAREFSKIILDEYSLEHIEDIAVMIKKYGADKVEEAFNKISQYKIDNPMRSLRYVAGILTAKE
ncbi:MAG: phospholipase D-like domain-containing protein [Candidatus Ancaeobacter aquaticus]|nr:phospholipase D-like domain-containing protein [Candidatus Ancaeobacter aquaticus]